MAHVIVQLLNSEKPSSLDSLEIKSSENNDRASATRPSYAQILGVNGSKLHHKLQKFCNACAARAPTP